MRCRDVEQAGCVAGWICNSWEGSDSRLLLIGFGAAFSLCFSQWVKVSGVPRLPAGGRWQRYATIDHSSSSFRTSLDPGIPEGRIP